MVSLTFASESLADTDRLGSALAKLLPQRSVVALNGTLGAGKTRLVEAIAAALKIPRDDVTSPTFVLCQHYQGTRTLHHFDAYRLVDEDDFMELGPEEYFDSDGICLIEWADRVRHALPENYLRIDIDVMGEQRRTFRISCVGTGLELMLFQLEQELMI